MTHSQWKSVWARDSFTSKRLGSNLISRASLSLHHTQEISSTQRIQDHKTWPSRYLDHTRETIWHDGCGGWAQLLSGLQEIRTKWSQVCQLSLWRQRKWEPPKWLALVVWYERSPAQTKTVVRTLISWHLRFHSHSLDLGPQPDLIRNNK